MHNNESVYNNVLTSFKITYFEI